MHLCPACGAQLTATDRCSWCGLDLTGAQAAELGALRTRLDAIDRDLYARSRERDEVVAQLTAALVPAHYAFTPPPPPVPTEGGPRGAEWNVDRVRSVLLWVGAALLAASALTFTAVAWTHLGDSGRAAMLVGFTMVAALLARVTRVRLPATAEAFTALTVALALVDWFALRHAGVGASASGATWWAFGTALVGLGAFVVGSVTAPRTGPVAAASLVPTSALLTIDVFAGAAWSAALALGALAAALAFAWRRTQDDELVSSVFAVEAILVWTGAALAAGAAATVPATFAAAVLPALGVLGLAGAPAVVRRLELVVAVVLGACVTLAAPVLTPPALVVFAAVGGAVAIGLSPWLPREFRDGTRVVGYAYGALGALWFAAVAVATTFGPLSWLHMPWTGDLQAAARTVVNGRHGVSATFAQSDVLVVALAGMGALLSIAVPKRRRALAPDLALTLGALIATAGAGMAPVLLGATALLAWSATLTIGTLLVLGSALVDGERPQLSRPTLGVALVALVPAAGWSALTTRASVLSLALLAGVGVVATLVARSDDLRAALGALTGATAVALAGVSAAAIGTAAVHIGLVVTITAGGCLLIGVLVRRTAADGPAVEAVAVAGMLVGFAMAAAQTAWLAGVLTAAVPFFALAALRRDRTSWYGGAAALAALGATWAWLAAASVTVVEAYTLPAAGLALGAGLVTWRRGPGRSWLSLGPAIVLGLGPTVEVAIRANDPWRTFAAAIAATMIVLLGARRRLQAPLVLGSGALLVLAIDTFGPAAARLPQWMPLAAAGVLLMFVGAKFERSRQAAQRASNTFKHFG